MRILSLSPKESNPLWIGNQKYNKDFPVYKFLAEKSIHSISSSKQSFREDWQAMKISAESEYELAEKLLSGKSNKREWLHEYISLGINKGGPTSFSTLTNLRNMVQVYEQFNWLVWAVGYFYFQGELEDNNFGLPPGDNDAWVEGFTWKGVYFRLIPLQHSYLIKQEVEAIKHITLELEEWFALEKNYTQRFNVDIEESYHRKIIPPLLSVTECGSFAIYGCPVIPIEKKGKSNPSVSIPKLQEEEDIDFSDSMLQLMPYLSKLTPENLVPLNMEGMEDKYMIINCHKVLQEYQPEIFSKCIIRIPESEEDEISIYPYPQSDSLPLEELLALFEGNLDETEDKSYSSKGKIFPKTHFLITLIELKSIAKERKHIKEYNFSSQGSFMKIMTYENPQNEDSINENERAKAVFMSRDDRIFRMASIKNKPPGIQFFTNELLNHNLIGESEIISGDVLLVVQQKSECFRLPYALVYGKPTQKPELYIERSIDRVREVLEVNNDITSERALRDYLGRKGIPESSIWILSVLIKTKLMNQICKCILLANAIKRIVDMEVFVMSNYESKDKIPKGITKEGELTAPLFTEKISFILENILRNNLDEESKLARNLLMTLFFYRLESLPFHNNLQFDIETKEYLQGKQILKDILKVSIQNPLLFLKTVENICNVKFSKELIRKWGIDMYAIVHSENPLEVDSNGPNVNASLHNYAPVSVRERMYFVMASFISTRESMDLDEESAEGTKQSEESDSVKNSYLDDEDDSEEDSEEAEGDSETSSSQKSSDEDDASDESYDSVASLKRDENSPPFKQVKFDVHENKINSVYSSRMSMISSHDNVLRASAPMMNQDNKNYIEIDNDYKKSQYLTKIFLQLPPSLYRLKLSTVELDSREVSRISDATNIGNHAEFLQEFSILRQNYSLQTLDDLNRLVMFLENWYKDVQSIEGDESAFLEILMVNNILLFVCDKFDDIYKNLEKAREILFNLAKWPLEIISMMQTFAGVLFEKENIVEAEKEYLMALIHYFPVLCDPRGRGAYSSNYLLALTWKASMIAHYYKKEIDAELWEEMLDATLHNLSKSKLIEYLNPQSPEEEKKWDKVFGQAPTKNKFTKPSGTNTMKPVKRDSNTKINIDDIDVELLSNLNNDSGDPFDDLKYTLSENRFLFYHWALYKDKVEDVEDYMRYGAGNQLDFFIHLLRSNPCMYMSGKTFTKEQIRSFTFGEGEGALNLGSTSSIYSGKDNVSSASSQASFSSTMSTTVKEKRQRSLHHGAYQHILNKDHYALSRSECVGVAFVWGTDTQGQLGWANQANLKFDEMDDNFKRYYPRILIGLKDLIIKEIWCGNEHSLAVTLEGNVYSWGNNSNHQLGIGYNSPKMVNQPARVYNIENVVQISCGYEHSMALDEDGDLYSWGHGEGGLLGHGELDDEATPKRIEEFVKKDLTVTKVACGGLHTLAIAGEGDVFSWGRAEGGQLGHSKEHLESLERLDLGISVPIWIISDKTIEDIAAGAAHSLALSDDGEVFAWGHNNYGQCGLGFSGENFEPGTGNAESCVFEPKVMQSLRGTKIEHIYAGSTFSMLLSEDQELYACGINDLGQCGIDTAHEELQKFEKIKDKAAHNFEVQTDISAPRKLECFYGMEVKGVACGEDHSFALINSGEKDKRMLWGWGMYKAGQLGLGRIKKRINPRLLQTLYNANIVKDKISWGSSNTLWIVGDPEKFKEEFSDDATEILNKSFQIGSENELWNVAEYQNEENFQLKMAEYN